MCTNIQQVRQTGGIDVMQKIGNQARILGQVSNKLQLVRRWMEKANIIPNNL